MRLCLSDPDKRFPRNDEITCVKRFDEKVIVVIIKRTGGIHFVVTAFSSSKIQKYL